MARSEMEEMAFEEEPDWKTNTSQKIERAVAHALHLFGVLSVKENSDKAKADLEQILKTTQKIERRTKQRNDADLRAWSAMQSTLKANLKDEE